MIACSCLTARYQWRPVTASSMTTTTWSPTLSDSTPSHWKTRASIRVRCLQSLRLYSCIELSSTVSRIKIRGSSAKLPSLLCVKNFIVSRHKRGHYALIDLSCSFHASATENLWYGRHSVFGCVRPSVSPWVCESAVHPDNFVNTISQKPVKGISPNFGHRFIWVDVLFRFWDQKVKGQRHSRQRNNRRPQPVEFHLISCYIYWTLWQINRFWHTYVRFTANDMIHISYQSNL